MTRVSRLLDSWRFWTLVAWVILAILFVWLLVVTTRLNDNTDAIEAATKANTEAIAFLCDTNAILQSLANTAVVYQESEQKEDPDPDRRAAIVIFRGFIAVIQERVACVDVEKVALPK